MADITEGAADLTQRVHIQGNDEIARLGGLINGMISKLHDLIGRIRISTVQLHTTGTEISASSAQQEAMIQGFGASTSQIAAAVKEISAAGQELLSTVNALRVQADETSHVADSGRDSLQLMQTNMQGLTEATSSISGKLGMIREKATAINAVVTTITKVADQTNLLSINAAVEAEEAGEAGRGFLVVAREIRRLADQTSVATLDIEQMVRHMQTAVSAGVMEMDRFHEGVRSSLERVNDVTGRMSQVIDQVQSLTQQFHMVREAVHQQSQGTQQIDDATSQLVSSVRQVNESVRSFHQASSNLRESASALQHEISQFDLGA
jgi:methyl-accepting chemotaxis protein WspA